MSGGIFNRLAGLFRSVDSPIFVNEFRESVEVIAELEDIARRVGDESVKEQIETEIALIRQGDQGERNVYYELKNSFIPMLVLHNLVIKYEDYKAQMDFVIITSEFICILETKKLNGHVTVNSDGDFIRSFTNRAGKVYKREGMYSPVAQNQRHVRILDGFLRQKGIIKRTPVLSLVVIANPKTMIDFKYVKKETRDQIVKYDQLTPRLKAMRGKKSSVDLAASVMYNIAEFLAENSVAAENTFANKYKSYLSDESAGTWVPITQAKVLGEEPVTYTPEPRVVHVTPSNANSTDKIRVALKSFRMRQSLAEGVKPYMVFNNNQMESLIEKSPKSLQELLACDGFGPVKVQKYGQEILSILKS